MTSSATSRLRLNFHHIKVDFKKSEVVLEGEPHLETEFILFQTFFRLLELKDEVALFLKYQIIPVKLM